MNTCPTLESMLAMLFSILNSSVDDFRTKGLHMVLLRHNGKMLQSTLQSSKIVGKIIKLTLSSLLLEPETPEDPASIVAT